MEVKLHEVGSKEWIHQQARLIIKEELFDKTDKETRNLDDYKEMVTRYTKMNVSGMEHKIRVWVRRYLFRYMQRHYNKRNITS